MYPTHLSLMYITPGLLASWFERPDVDGPCPPFRYFAEVVSGFEQKMAVFRAQLEELDGHVNAFLATLSSSVGRLQPFPPVLCAHVQLRCHP